MIGANVSVFSIGKAVGRGGGGLEPFSATWAVISGGGGGGGTGVGPAGGGGAGGRLEGTTTLEGGVAYRVTIGAGGAYGGFEADGDNGSVTTLATLALPVGGGGGGDGWSSGILGGSGGGGGYRRAPGWVIPIGGAGTSGQGNSGGDGNWYGGQNGGGGGGSSGAGGDGSTTVGGSGGAGSFIVLNGVSVKDCGGGGGGGSQDWPNQATATNGGGVGGNGSVAGVDGTVNTGGGGGGFANYVRGGNGGSGFIAILYPDNATPTVTAGVTSTIISGGTGYKIIQITAAGPSDTVTFG
jgi:hypothetical protein